MYVHNKRFKASRIDKCDSPVFQLRERSKVEALILIGVPTIQNRYSLDSVLVPVPVLDHR
jgi:hypothetical protein